MTAIEPLGIEGAWVVTPALHGDARGVFLESFRGDLLAPHVGHRLDVVQVNTSVSAAGVVRGVHFADVPPGQAKYVTCVAGSALDVVVDVRVGSPTFGRVETVLLDTVDRRAVYLGEGLGHAFMALADGTTLNYLCSTGYAPGREHGIDPLDPALGIAWPTEDESGATLIPLLSEKDRAAPGLEAAAAEGLLPDYDDVRRYYQALAGPA